MTNLVISISMTDLRTHISLHGWTITPTSLSDCSLFCFLKKKLDHKIDVFLRQLTKHKPNSIPIVYLSHTSRLTTLLRRLIGHQLIRCITNSEEHQRSYSANTHGIIKTKHRINKIIATCTQWPLQHKC